MEPTVQLDTGDPSLKVMKRRWKDADVYLFFNEGDRACDRSVKLFSKGRRVEVWDAQTGNITPVRSTGKAGRLIVQLALQPYEARVLVVR